MKYTPTEWDSSAQKEKFEKKFKKFVLSDFKDSLFPKWFYQRLMNTFGHIAHYNQGGFYGTWFSTTEQKLDFLRYTARGGAYGICGDPAFTYSDVERVLSEWVRDSGLIDKYQKALNTQTETTELSMLAALQNKYPNAI